MPRATFPRYLYALCILLVLLSGTLRFSHLETKVFWHDEAFTAVPVSGHERRKIRSELFKHAEANNPFTVQDFQTFQVPADGTSLADTIEGVAEEEPQNAPLYFILARLWLELTQLPTVLGLRLLSVIIGLAIFPGMYRLGQQLFQSRAIAWTGVALTLTSPLHLIYAQEARQYSLLTALTVWSSVFLLQAIQAHALPRQIGAWMLYSIGCIAGLYTHPFFAFVMVAHGGYTLFSGKFAFRKIALYLTSSLLSVYAFWPWVQIILDRLDAISNWREVTILPLSGLIGRWLLNLCRVFVDLHRGDRPNYDLHFNLTDPYLYASLGILGLVAIAFFTLIRNTDRRSWLFVVSLTLIPTLILAIPDVVEGGIRSTIPRYILPSVVGIQLAIAYLLGTHIVSPQLSLRNRQVWRSIFALILTLGIISGMQMSRTQTWWSKYSNYYDPEIAALINAVPAPAVIGEGTIRLLSVSYLLRPDTTFFTSKNDQLPPIPDNPNIFIYDLDIFSQNLRTQLLDQYRLNTQLVYHRPLGFMTGEIQLWKTEPVS